MDVPEDVPIAYAVFCLILSSTNNLLHIGGIYLLLLAHLKNKENSQTLYLLNFAVTELLWSLFCVWSDIVQLSNIIENNIHHRSSDFELFLNLVTFSFNAAAMFMITADRLYQALYPLHHRAYWTACKTKIVICTSWVLAVILQLIVLAYLTEKNENYPYVICILYFLFAMFTYSRMFSEYVKSRRRVQTTQRTSLLRIFTDSRFSFSILLMGSYLLLVIAPLSIILLNLRTTHSYTCYHGFGRILIRFSATFDAILYIFLYKPVRSIRKEKCTCFRGSDSQIVAVISIARVIYDNTIQID